MVRNKLLVSLLPLLVVAGPGLSGLSAAEETVWADATEADGSVVPWAVDEGISLGNRDVDYPDGSAVEVLERGMPAAAQRQFDIIVRVQEIFLELIEERIKDLPTGAGSDREEAFKGQNFIIIMHLGAPMVLYPAMGTLGGGAIGIVVDCFLMGSDMGAGTLVGLMGGAAVGTGAGVLHAGIAAIVLANNTERILKEYPEGKKSAVRTRGAESDWDTVSFEQADDWVDLPLEEEEEVEEVGDNGGVTERGTTPVRVLRTTRIKRPATRRYAGPQESLYIHLIKELFADKILLVADRWTRAPGLTSRQRRALAQVPFVRKSLQHIAYVKRYSRVAPGAPPAAPLDQYTKTMLKTLTGDAAATRQLMLYALGMGKTSIAVRKGKLTWTTPAALRLVGAPPAVQVSLPGGSVKVGGKGGFLDPYVKVSLTPGPFDIRLGEARLSGKNVVFGFRIAKGSKLCSATVKFKAGGPPKTLGGCSPRLTKDLTGSIYLKVSNPGFALDRITLGGASLSLGLPKSSIPGVKSVMKKVSSPLKKAIEKFVKKSSAWSSFMGRTKIAVAQNLLLTLKKNAGKFGVKDVKEIRQLQITGGRILAQVLALAIDPSKIPFSKSQAAAFKGKALAGLKKLR